jgi:hypothetical protein
VLTSSSRPFLVHAKEDAKGCQPQARHGLQRRQIADQFGY